MIPAIPLLGIYPKEIKSGSRRDICTPMFTTALFTIAKIGKQHKCPSMDKWIKKIWHVCACVCVCVLPYLTQYNYESPNM